MSGRSARQLFTALLRFPDTVKDFFVSNSDPTMARLPLLSSPWHLMAITGFYLFFCIRMGPAVMKRRQPIQVRKALVAFNAFQIAFNLALMLATLYSFYFFEFDFRCQMPRPVGSPAHRLETAIAYCGLVSKIIDLMDTVFHVLGKRFHSISQLHLSHHFLVVWCTWIGCRVFPGGHVLFATMLNHFVHTIMYSYYLLAALGPEYKQYLWWKRHLTTAQMIQFLIVFVHSIQIFFNGCEYPKFLPAINIGLAVLFWILFSNFYYRTYMKRRQKREAGATADHARVKVN